MNKISENLVEEYFNRKGFFTIRGVKQGTDEIDVLAISYGNKLPKALHIEVQTSFRPVSYLSNSNARRRSSEEVQAEMEHWINKKYKSERKQKIRNNLWPGLEWEFIFVHARLKDNRELIEIKKNNIKTIELHEIIKFLVTDPNPNEFRLSSNGDISEILKYIEEIQ